MAAPGKVLLEGGMGTFFDRRVQLDQLKPDISCYSLARAWMQNSANSLADEVPESTPDSWSADTFCRLRLPKQSTEPLNYREALQKPASLALMVDLPPRGGTGDDASDDRGGKRVRYDRRASAKASETDSDADLIDGSSEAADDVLRNVADTGSVLSDVATAADGASETDDARSAVGEGAVQDEVVEGVGAEGVVADTGVADAASKGGADEARTLKDEAVGKPAADTREHHAAPRSAFPSPAQASSMTSSPFADAASPSRALKQQDATFTPKLETSAEASSSSNLPGSVSSATDRSALSADVAGRGTSKRTRAAAASAGSSVGGVSASCSACCSGSSSLGRSLGSSVSDGVRGSGEMGSGSSASAPRPPAPHKQSSSDSSARSMPGDGQLKLAHCGQRRAAVPKLLQQHLERFQCVRQFARAQSVCRLRRVRKRIALLIGLANAEKAQGGS